MKTVFDCYCYESASIQLWDFIDYAIQESDAGETAIKKRRKEIFRSLNTHTGGGSGQTIYDYVRNLILG
jgi:hypothetical protein